MGRALTPELEQASAATPEGAKDDSAKPVRVVYFTDVLCFWAYVAQMRIDAIQRDYGPRVAIEHRFVSVFGDTAGKIGSRWGGGGGYAAFNAHLLEAAEAIPEVRISPEIWLTARPASSLGAHLILKGVQIAEAGGGCPAGAFERSTYAMRRAFFEQVRDIAQADVQRDVLRQAGVDPGAVDPILRDGRAHAAMASDLHEAAAMGVQGSPSFVLNDGRQKLYGNVGYRIIDANIQELIREPHPGQASWC